MIVWLKNTGMRIGFIHEYLGSETRPSLELSKAICWNLGQRLN
jgi:hypothetical protein